MVNNNYSINKNDGHYISKFSQNRIDKYTTLTNCNMRQRTSKRKMFNLVKKLSNHPLATPFLKKKDAKTASLEDITKQINELKYESSHEILNDILKLLENPFTTNKNSLETKEITTIANKLKNELIQMYEDIIEDSKPTTKNIEIKQCHHQHTMKGHQQNENSIRFFKFFPSRDHEFTKPNINHAYIAGYQFYKMVTCDKVNDVPLRKVLNQSDAIESITYIHNQTNLQQYEEQKKSFLYQGKTNRCGNVNEVLLFHGTTVSCLNSIATHNFDINASPQQLTTTNQTRKKSMIFGKGVYLTEIPTLSLMYGNGLLLCKVLPGNCENLNNQADKYLPFDEKYDSREIKNSLGIRIMQVIRRTSQILPYCIISLKPKSLTTEYMKKSSKATQYTDQTTSTSQESTKYTQTP